MIVGAGAIGGFYGGKLAEAGAQVSVVCRSNYSQVQPHGFEIYSPLGDFRFCPHRVHGHTDKLCDVVDIVIVATKSMPTAEWMGQVSSIMVPTTSIVLLQNGINIEQPVRDVFPHNELISGVSYVCLNQTSHGVIQHFDYGHLTFGVYPGGESVRVNQLAELFRSVNIACEVTASIQKSRWEKMVWNVPFNPLSILHSGRTTQQILETEEGRVRDIMAEVCQLAEADGWRLDMDIIDRNIERTIKMKPYKTSMLLDMRAGRPLELAAILGNVLRFADRQNMPVPAIRQMYNEIKCANL